MKLEALSPVFKGRLHDARTAPSIGRWLGVVLVLCFIAGLVSHFMQHPPGLLPNSIPSRPTWGCRLSQGLHVVSGTAAVPFAADEAVGGVSAVVRGAAVAVGQARPGTAAGRGADGRRPVRMGDRAVEHGQWYAWPFSFASVHYAVKAHGTGRSPRTVALFAPRHPDRGPKGLPVYRPPAAAGVGGNAAEEYCLVVVTSVQPYALSLDELRALPQHQVELLARAGASAHARVRVESLEPRGGYRELGPEHARDPLTLLALGSNGEELHPDHGYPARFIAPDRPKALGVVLGAAGVVHMAAGVDVRDPIDVLMWLGGAVLLHDVVIAPFVLLVGWVLVRGGGRSPVRGALLIAGVLTTVTLPVLLRSGKTANASVLPLDHPHNWLIAIVAVAAVTAVWLAVRGFGPAHRQPNA